MEDAEWEDEVQVRSWSWRWIQQKSEMADRPSEVGDWRLETSQPASNNEQRTTDN